MALRRPAKLGLDIRGRVGIPAVSFARPEMSPGLAKVRAAGEERHARAMEVPRAGEAALGQRPSAEMPGFRYEGVEAQREGRDAEMKGKSK
jgi:hypothetical protein